MEFFNQTDLDYIVKSAQQYEFLVYNSIIAEIEKNILSLQANAEPEILFKFNKKHCSLTINNDGQETINLLAVQAAEWEEEYGPMHMYTELIGNIEEIYFSFECMHDTKMQDRFENYRKILLNLNEKFESLSRETIENLYLYWKEGKDFDYNHHTKTLYELPVAIPNENMARKFDKWNQSFHYQENTDAFLLKVASTICYELEVNFKLENQKNFVKKELAEMPLIKEIDAQFPYSAKTLSSKIKDYFKYNRNIDFNQLDENPSIRSSQYFKIISDMANSPSGINDIDTLQLLIKVEKDLIQKNINNLDILPSMKKRI